MLPFKNSILCIVLILASCSTGQLTLNVLEPAKITIPPEIRKVTLFTGAGIPDVPGVIDTISKIELDPDYNYYRIKRGYIEGLYDIMSASPRFQRVVMTDTSYEQLVYTGMISWEELRQICTHDSTSTVLMLKKAISADKIARYNIPDVGCRIFYLVINHTKWAFFQPFLEKEYDNITFNDSTLFEQENDCDDPGTLQNIPDVLYDAFYTTGSMLGKNISPSWDYNVSRFFYIAPGREMRYAAQLVINNQWNQAAVIWNEMSENRKRSIASHASFNMALAWEQEDDIDQALLWINYADSILSNAKTRAYKKILNMRLKNKALLNLQMSVN